MREIKVSGLRAGDRFSYQPDGPFRLVDSVSRSIHPMKDGWVPQILVNSSDRTIVFLWNTSTVWVERD